MSPVCQGKGKEKERHEKEKGERPEGQFFSFNPMNEQPPKRIEKAFR